MIVRPDNGITEKNKKGFRMFDGSLSKYDFAETKFQSISYLLIIIPYSSKKKLMFVSNFFSPPSPKRTRRDPPVSRYFFKWLISVSVNFSLEKKRLITTLNVTDEKLLGQQRFWSCHKNKLIKYDDCMHTRDLPGNALILTKIF